MSEGSNASLPLVRVLVIDDSDMFRERLVQLIGRIDGVEVVGEARDGNRAVEMVRALHPDVVTLDLMMPERSGFEALQEMKQLPAPPAVIVLTDYPYPTFRRRCEELGADFFFSKSTEFKCVIEVLENRVRGGDEGRASEEGQQMGPRQPA